MITAIYADGGVIGASRSEIGGMYAWCHVDAADRRIAHDSGLVLPHEVDLPTVTNNLTEFIALLQAMEALPAGWRGTVHSDSWITLQRFFRGAKLNGIPQPLITRLRALHQRFAMAQMPYVLLDGHPTREQLATGIGKRGNPVSQHNVWCDRACGKVGREYADAQRLAQLTSQYQGGAT
jgi:ribonuclease HI